MPICLFSLGTRELQLCQGTCYRGLARIKSKGHYCDSEEHIMIRIAVCDDDRIVRESIVKALRRYERDNGMEFEVLWDGCRKGDQAV